MEQKDFEMAMRFATTPTEHWIKLRMLVTNLKLSNEEAEAFLNEHASNTIPTPTAEPRSPRRERTVTDGTVKRIVRTRRTRQYQIGVEIECYVDLNRTLESMRDEGVNVEYENYNHHDYTDGITYKFVTDSSVSGTMNDNCGIELVSPVLDEVQSLEKVCKQLNLQGAQVNEKCGLHVHIGTTGFSAKQLKNIYVNYSRLQQAINKVLAPKRSSSNYSKPNIDIEDINIKTNSIREMAEAILRKHNNERYFAVNPKAYDNHNTVEFRQHEGTTDFNEICMWTEFLIALCKYSKNLVAEKGTESLTELDWLSDELRNHFAERERMFS